MSLRRLSVPMVRRAYSTDALDFTPRRSLLYVPASNEKMVAKIPSMGADCVVLECEDGVALSAKAAARDACRRFLSQRPSKLACAELGLRVNSASSGLLADDIISLGAATFLPQALMLPKVDSLEDLREFSSLFLAHIGSTRQAFTDKPVNLVVWLESAVALLEAPSLLRAAKGLSAELPNIRLAAAVFGSDDYCADVGATRSSGGEELAWARQRFRAVTAAARIQAIDAVFIDTKDLDGLGAQSRQGAAWGYDGKQVACDPVMSLEGQGALEVIHPSQVAVVQAAFSPSAERVSWASELVSEFARHSGRGEGAFVFRGSMVDAPLLAQAQRVLRLKDRL